MDAQAAHARATAVYTDGGAARLDVAGGSAFFQKPYTPHGFANLDAPR
ncbi:MAG TPA: hypothetical protein VFV75_12395 [Candidatus Polarisedimenticolaceae bacterium]|nr:hypothetical protein [Candidatus Polarisedimenticolaceae bacterium]